MVVETREDRNVDRLLSQSFKKTKTPYGRLEYIAEKLSLSMKPESQPSLKEVYEFSLIFLNGEKNGDYEYKQIQKHLSEDPLHISAFLRCKR
jgi:hypothetical protein